MSCNSAPSISGTPLQTESGQTFTLENGVTPLLVSVSRANPLAPLPAPKSCTPSTKLKL